MSQPIWISMDVSFALHSRQLAEHGGGEGTCDKCLLEPALTHPQHLYFYGDPPPDTCALATAYAFAIIKNAPFTDGNQRTAHVMMRLFLIRNGRDLVASKEDRYFTILALAAGEHTEDSFATWPRENSAPLEHQQ